MPDLVTADNPVAPVADNPPVAEPVAADPGTSAASGQAQGGAPTEDLFKGIDPNRLPPEARAAYDSMLKDYRAKTGKLSETVKAEVAKAAEAYRQKAEFYDSIATQEEFVKRWNEYVQQKNSELQAKESDPQQETAKKLEALESKIQRTENLEAINTFASAVDEKGNKLHADFDSLNNIIVSESEVNGQKQSMSLLSIAVDLSEGRTPLERIANGYKAAKQLHDTIFEAGKKAGMGRVQQKLQFGSQPPSSVSPTSTAGRRPKNAMEALQFAKQGLPVFKE